MVTFSKLNYFLLLIAAFILACQLPIEPVISEIPVQDSLFLKGALKGKLENPEINEASGLAASWSNPGMLWTHNDSGNKSQLFLVQEDGAHAGEFFLEGKENRDWEDIATGPGPIEGKEYVYVGNIGDNLAQYEQVYVYRFEEPEVSGSDLPVSETIPASKIQVLTLKYPGGARDAEALLVDPLTKDLFVVTKREENVRVYKAPFPQSTTEPMEMEMVGELPFTWITAGDISADGQEILLKNYEQVFYWKRKPGQSIEEALQQPPLQLPYQREPQGEAIAWKMDGSGYFTTSELFTEPDAKLFFYKRLKDK